MSNHDGSYMLNQMVHGLIDLGILKDISATQKKGICKLLWGTCFDYDCNWPEIIDEDLAMLLATCACCGCDSAEISAGGYCVECDDSASFRADESSRRTRSRPRKKKET